jgi:hypothetical protein
VIGVITLVGDDGFGLKAFDEIVRLGDVVALAWPEQQADRIAERVGRGVDFGAQAAAGAAQALGIRPPLAIRAPAACWWARMMVESIISHSRSASVVSACKRSAGCRSAARADRLFRPARGPGAAPIDRHAAHRHPESSRLISKNQP